LVLCCRFSRCFASGLIHKYDDATITIGLNASFTGWGMSLHLDFLFIGTFISGSLNGQGKKLYGIDTSYIGEFKDGLLYGHGLIICKGIQYEGEWYRGVMNGLGSITYADGIKFEGKWHADMPEFDLVHPLVKECVEKGKRRESIAK
jgi:hypothetical protein